MFEHLSTPFPIAKPLNKVARYVSNLYPDCNLEEYWRTYPCPSNVSYHIHFSQYTLGVLYQDKYTDDVILVLNTELKLNEDFRAKYRAITVGNDLVVKWLECVPILCVNNTIIFEVTREDIPNV